RGKAPEDSEDEEEVDDFFDARMHAVNVNEGNNEGDDEEEDLWLDHVRIDESLYEEEEDRRIGKFLMTLERPTDLTDQQFTRFRRMVLTFFLQDGFLYKCGRHGSPPRRVVGRQAEREAIIQELHDELGHRGEKTTFEHVKRRYQWKGMWTDCVKHVKTCK